jgi:hypothetical protein
MLGIFRNQTGPPVVETANLSTIIEPVVSLPVDDDLSIPTIAWPFIISGKYDV